MSHYKFGQIWRIDPINEVIRREFSGVEGNSGFVVSDIDHLIRRYGPKFDLSQDGDLMLIEKKEGTAELKEKDKNIQQWFNRELSGHPGWRGFHLLQVHYESTRETCPCCQQPVFNLKNGVRLMDAESRDRAYMLGKSAKLTWNGRPMKWEEFKNIIEGKKQ